MFELKRDGMLRPAKDNVLQHTEELSAQRKICKDYRTLVDRKYLNNKIVLISSFFSF